MQPQRTAQQPVGLKHGFLFKCSQKLKLWTTTWFVLGPKDLMYYKRGMEVPKVISLEQPVSIVAADVEDSKRPHSFKLSTPAFPRTLILAAESSELVDEWIASIRTVSSLYGPPPETSNNAGPVKLTPDQKEMLQCTTDIVILSGTLIQESAQSNVPGVYIKGTLDSLSSSSLACATTGRVVVYKPKIQSGFTRFSANLQDMQTHLIKYKRNFNVVTKRKGKGKGANNPLSAVTKTLESLIAITEKAITKWIPEQLDPELTAAEEEEEGRAVPDEDDEEGSGVGEEAVSPYVSPFFINPANSPPPCKKHWDMLVDECSNMVSYMESLVNATEPSHLKLPSPSTIALANQFLELSKRLHDEPSAPRPDEAASVLTEEEFSLMQQQLLGSISSIDYHAANIGLLCNETVPSQMIDVISHAHSISSAISKLPRAIKKHRAKTLISAVENIGSFSFSLSKLILEMVDQENFLRDPERGRHTLHDEVHAVQYIAVHMLGLCPQLLSTNFASRPDILHLTDTAKLLALGVTNTLESVRVQLRESISSPASKRKRASPRKLASELTDAATGSMVFWFGLVGQEASVHLEV